MQINGVFEGGGVKGIALAGAVSAALNRGFQFKQVAGTSSGSIVAAFLVAGYNGNELKQMISETPFHSFLKRSWIYNVKYVGPAVRLLTKKGLYSGEALEAWVTSKLAAKKLRTFGDLEPNQLRIVASDISHGKLLVLPDDIEQYGIDPRKFSIAKAVRMSTSIPYFFDPVTIRQSAHAARTDPTGSTFVYIVDGGVLSNFPLWLFDSENIKGNISPTLGFSLVGKSSGHMYEIKDPFSMLQALFATMMEAHDERYIEKHNRFRTVKIPTLNVHTTDFNISVERSEALYDAGYQAADEFLSSWSMEKYRSEYNKFVLPK
jgi:NTE family protein